MDMPTKIFTTYITLYYDVDIHGKEGLDKGESIKVNLY